MWSDSRVANAGLLVEVQTAAAGAAEAGVAYASGASRAAASRPWAGLGIEGPSLDPRESMREQRIRGRVTGSVLSVVPVWLARRLGLEPDDLSGSAGSEAVTPGKRLPPALKVT